MGNWLFRFAFVILSISMARMNFGDKFICFVILARRENGTAAVNWVRC